MRTIMTRLLSALLSLLLMASLCAPAISSAEEGDHPTIAIEVTDYGTIYAELYPEYAPKTVENFLKLIDQHFYDGLTFHRIISGFMVQGGDPLGNGTGGSSENIPGEFSSNGVDNPLLHERGVLSMARSSNPDSASSQFFIMHQTSPHLDGSYAAFGKVLAGMNVVDLLCIETPVQDQNGTVAPADQPHITTIRIVDPEEANAAAELEQSNGLVGGVFQDPYSPLYFSLSGTYHLLQSAQGQSIFQEEDSASPIFVMRSQNIWAQFSDGVKASFGDASHFNTSEIEPAAFASRIGLDDAEALVSVEHGQMTFFQYDLTADDSSAEIFLGAHDGYLYLIEFFGGKGNPAYDTFASILGSISFVEATSAD